VFSLAKNAPSELFQVVDEGVHSANAALYNVMRDPWNNDASHAGHDLVLSCQCGCETTRIPGLRTASPELPRAEDLTPSPGASLLVP